MNREDLPSWAASYKYRIGYEFTCYMLGAVRMGPNMGRGEMGKIAKQTKCG